MIEKHYTVTEVAKLLAVSPKTIRRWIDAGTLPAIDLNPSHQGRAAMRVPESVLTDLLERMAANRPKRRSRKTGFALKPLTRPATKSDVATPKRSARRKAKPQKSYV